jgi:hypothetical protein
MALGRPTTPIRAKSSVTGALLFTLASTGASPESYNLGATHRYFTIQNAKLVKGSGGPTALAFRLQGSINGSDWHNLMAAASATTASATMTNTTAAHAVLYVRINSTGKTGGTGGTSTVTFSVAIPGE